MAGCDASDNNRSHKRGPDNNGGYFFFKLWQKPDSRVERAVEIKTNGSTQNENNLKAQTSPDFRSTGAFVRKISMTTITFFVCDDDGLTTQTSVLMGIRR